MVFAFPWLGGLPLAFAGRGAARCGGYRFCAFVVMCRDALRRVRRLRRNLLVSLLRSRPALNYCARAPRGGVVGRRRRRVLPSVVGDWDVWGRDGGGVQHWTRITKRPGGQAMDM